MIVFAQEFVQKKGVFRGLAQGDPVNIMGLVGTFLAVAAVGASFALRENNADTVQQVPLRPYQLNSNVPSPIQNIPVGRAVETTPSIAEEEDQWEVSGVFPIF